LVKRSLLGFLLLLVGGCAGGGAPAPASYCGEMSDSGNYDLYGRVVMVIGPDNRVLGTLEREGLKFEIRGEMHPSGIFTGLLDGTDYDYVISGSILSQDDDRAYANWTIDGDGDEDDSVSFWLGKC
jgi:hypothetical protein